MKKKLNKDIRNDIDLYVRKKGSYNTRDLILDLATKHKTSKQRISGNISFVSKIKQNHITVIIPKKESYIH